MRSSPEKEREYQRRYRQRHREQVLAAGRAAKAAIPLEQKRAYNAKWRETVSEEWREAKRAYNRERERRIREADPDYYPRRRVANLARYHEYDRQKYLRHREKAIASASRHAQIRRVRKAGNETYRVTDRDWRRLVDRYEGRCAYCGRVAQLEREHIIPVVKGGRDSIGNLIPACHGCNLSKGTRYLVEWRARQRKGLAA